jgi:TusA-related sulfurtransferase
LITQLEVSQSQIPEWIKNTMKWYAEEKISQQEMINALQFMIKEKIIKLD